MRILIVEDNEKNRYLLRTLLEGNDHQVVAAEHGGQALELARANPPDVIVTDILMPVMDGFELCRQVKQDEKLKDILLVFYTATYTDAEDEELARKLGADKFIRKPQDSADFARIIQETFRDAEKGKVKAEPWKPTFGKEEEVFERYSRRLVTKLEKKMLENHLAYEEIKRLKDQLAEENIYLQQEIKSEHDFEQTIGKSAALNRVLKRVEMVAPTDSSILITGETGTGKELIARAIHDLSIRKKRPLIKIACPAIPTELFENELFGHEKGAFTGATSRRIGYFEVAHQSTIFLDEIGDLAPEVQVKLLRILDEHAFQRVGGTKTIKVDVRIIAATNRALKTDVAKNRFRADLYYRLNVFPIHLPPLRERSEDIPLLVEYFVKKYAARMGKQIDKVPKETMKRLTVYSWPGNIRELKNVIERSLILCQGPTVEIEEEALQLLHRPPSPDTNSSVRLSELEIVERDRILEALHQTRGNKAEAARRLRIERKTLYRKAQRLGIDLHRLSSRSR